jgi:uncharacterized protein DUF1579
MQRTVKTLVCAFAVCLFTAALGARAAGAEDQPATPPAQPQLSAEAQAEMDAWMKVGSPGKEHEQLAAAVGDWKASGKSYMGPEPTAFEATSHRQLTLGGRVLEEHFKGEMMGMAFEGHGLTGYDNARKQWWSTWNDSMSTGVLLSYGNWDDAAKGIVFNGELVDPQGKPLKVRLVTRRPSAGTEQFEYWEERGGKLTKTMEMTLTKQ